MPSLRSTRKMIGNSVSIKQLAQQYLLLAVRI